MFTLLEDSLLSEYTGELTQSAQTNANGTLPVAGAWWTPKPDAAVRRGDDGIGGGVERL